MRPPKGGPHNAVDWLELECIIEEKDLRVNIKWNFEVGKNAMRL